MTPRIRVAFAVAIVALSAGATPVVAMGAISARAASVGGARAVSAARFARIDPARARAMLADADALERAGHVSAARKMYRALIDQQRQSEQYPLVALWQLANSYFYRDDEARTAEVLDELAESAAHFGDPTTELRASFEAAVIYQHLDASAKVVARIAHVRVLLKSPAIADATKREIQGRLVTG